jgi:nitrilase
MGNIGQLACWEHTQPLLKYHTISQREAFHVAAWPPVPSYGGQRELWSMSREGEFAHQQRYICVTDAVAGVRNLAQTYAIESGPFTLHTTAVITQKGIDLMQTSGGAVMREPGGGSSCIFDPDGRQITEDLDDKSEGIIYADLDKAELCKAKCFLDIVGHYSRPDLLWLGVNKEEMACLRH